MADVRTYTYTEAQLSQLEALLKDHGVIINATQPGEVNEQGWDIAWTFPDPAHIEITVKHHPFAEEGFMWSKLDDIFN